ncbi:hypothetical protein D3C80_2002160 [compost metagenome]
MVKNVKPRSSKPLMRTMRALGWPLASTVAKVMALGSGTLAARASSNQRVNCSNGEAAAWLSNRTFFS